MRGIAVKFWALLLAASAPAMSIAAPAQAQIQTTGRNVTAVMVDAGPNAQYVKQGPNTWAELDTRGRTIFTFREARRDDWSVYLVDTGRGIEIQLDLHRRKVTISTRGGPRRDLYNIIRFTHNGANYDVRGGDVRDRGGDGPRGGDVRDRDVRDRDDSRTVEVGPIWNQADAERKCRAKAQELRGEWTGQWWTTVQGRMSVCEIRFGGWGRDDRGPGRGGRDEVRDVEVGPIWNQRDAETKCRNKANELRGEWTGNWSTVRPGMSVCAIRMRGGGGYGGGYNQGVTREIEVGPLWNQRDAETKCRNKAQELRGEWTGQWRTTVQGRMSVCEIRMR